MSIFNRLMDFARKYVLVFLVIAVGLAFVNQHIAKEILGRSAMGADLTQIVVEHLITEPVCVDQEGLDALDRNHSFVMVLDLDGRVIWSYKKPAELPESYTLKDVVNFSSNMLWNYQVQYRSTDNRIVVVGALQSDIPTENDLVTKTVAWLIILDAFVFYMVLYFFITKESRASEKKRAEWISGVTHDIRSPLTSINLRVHSIKTTLAYQNNLTEELEQKINQIERDSLEVSDLVEDLNLEMKLLTNRAEWVREEVNLPHLIQNAICDVWNRENRDNVEISCEIEPELEQTTVLADRVKVHNMLENLVKNIFVHNPDGCKAICTLQSCKIVKPLTKVESRWNRKYRYVLTIEDDGAGVSEEVLQNFRVPLSDEDKLGDHKNGMRKVRRIIEKHGWKVAFDNCESGGFRTRIWIR